MSARATIPTARRPELVFNPLGDRGEYVVKDPRTREYFKFGVEGHFLLTQLDGRHTGEAIRAACAERFGQPLSEEDLQGFLELAQARGLLQTAEDKATQPVQDRPRQSLLAWRRSFFDPDRLFTFLEPRLWFFWTSSFLVLSAVCILAAVVLVAMNRHELASSFAGAVR